MPQNVILDFLDCAQKRSLTLAAQIRYDGSNRRHVYLLSLYGTVLEIARALVVVARADAPVGIPILLRSMLEASVDLRNLARDPLFGYVLEANAIEQQLKFLNNLEANTSAVAEKIKAADPDFSGQLARFKARLSNIAEKAGANRSIFQRFKKAGMENEYQTVYAALCSAAHNDAITLTGRHLVAGENPVHFHREISLSEIEHYFGMAAAMVIESTLSVHGVMESSVLSEAAALKAELDRFVGADPVASP